MGYMVRPRLAVGGTIACSQVGHLTYAHAPGLRSSGRTAIKPKETNMTTIAAPVTEQDLLELTGFASGTALRTACTAQVAVYRAWEHTQALRGNWAQAAHNARCATALSELEWASRCDRGGNGDVADAALAACERLRCLPQ